MRLVSRRFTAIAVFLAATACAGRQTAPGPAVDRNLLIPDQFADRGFSTAYDVIESMRSNWLAAHGPDSFTAPSQVQVYLDGTRVGGVDMLRNIDLRPVTYMRHFDGIAATARWGLDHGAGAIYVSTHPLADSSATRDVFAIPETIGRP